MNKRMKSAKTLLLIEPPFNRLYKDTYSLNKYPLGLGYLAAVVRRDTEWDVRVYNTDFTPDSEPLKMSYMTGEGFERYTEHLNDLKKPIWEEIKKKIIEISPDIVGISSKSQNFASARNIASIVKSIDEKITVIVGGPHPTMVPDDVLECNDIDIVVRGEGEEKILELLENIGSDLETINGISYRKNGKKTHNPVRELIDDLDKLPFPHEYAKENLIDYEKYPITSYKSIFAIRGCPNNCFFCGSRKIWGRKVRFRSVENVLEEIKKLRDMGLNSIHFDDDTFGINKKYLKELCKGIKEHAPDMKWSCEIHVRLVDDESIRIMKDAGCYLIQIGVESGNNYILEKMRKNITIKDAYKACKTIKKHGILLEAFFMVGFPYDTEDTIRDTAEAMKKIDCDTIVYSIFTPYPGTEAYEFCRKQCLVDDSYDPSKHNHQSPENCFCLDIDKKRFRDIVKEIEVMVDKRNKWKKYKQILSMNTLWQLKQWGFINGIKRGIKILK